MTLRLHIESLSLEGVDVPRSQRPQLQAALEVELVRLLTVHGVPEALRQGGRIGKLPANLTLGGKPNPTELGEAIARSIYTDLNPGGMTYGSATGTAANNSARGNVDYGVSATGKARGAEGLGG